MSDVAQWQRRIDQLLQADPVDLALLAQDVLLVLHVKTGKEFSEMATDIADGLADADQVASVVPMLRDRLAQWQEHTR